jgi:hypothetical protein
MTRVAHRVLPLAILSLAVAWGAGGCGSEEDNLGPGGNNAVVGTWDAATFIVQGTDLIAQGMSLSFTFTGSGSYSFTITNDQGGLCDGAADCSDNGLYSASATQIILDPGTIDEATLNYTIAGNTMTVTAVIDGTPIAATFTKQ